MRIIGCTLELTAAFVGGSTERRLVIIYSRRVMISVAIGLTTEVTHCTCDTAQYEVRWCLSEWRDLLCVY